MWNEPLQEEFRVMKLKGLKQSNSEKSFVAHSQLEEIHNSHLSASEMNRRSAVAATLSDRPSAAAEPDLSAVEFSKLKISPKPLHTRQTRSRTSAVAANVSTAAVAASANSSAIVRLGFKSSNCNTPTVTDSQSSKPHSHLIEKISNNQSDCRRSLRLSSKMDKSPVAADTISHKSTDSLTHSSPSSTSSTSSTSMIDSSTGLLELNNNFNNTDTQSTIWKIVMCEKARRPTGSSTSGYTAGSAYTDDGIFSETDEEISEINSHRSNQTFSSSSRSSSRLSCKRKRNNTLSADLEVESLLESGTESVSSVDTRSLSDFSEAEVLPAEIPRKRHCSGAPDDSRPFLDLEKMQGDQVPTRGQYRTRRSKPPAVKGLCTFSPIDFDLESPNRDMMSSAFRSVPPVEQPTACYS